MWIESAQKQKQKNKKTVTKQLSNCGLTGTRAALRPHPDNTSKSHVVSHHSAVAMDTHIKLHHLPCPPPFHSTPPPTRLNPIQPNSGIRPASPPRLLRSRTSCWQIRLHSPVPPLSPFPPHPLRPPAPSLSIHPSSATTHSPLLLPPPHTHTPSLSLPLLSVP